MRKLLFVYFLLQVHLGFNQIKYIIEDFEGFSNSKKNWEKNGLFQYGQTDAEILKHEENINNFHLGSNYIQIKNKSKFIFGGIGKTINHVFYDLSDKDFLNFYYRKKSGAHYDTIYMEFHVKKNIHEKPSIYLCQINIPDEFDWKILSIPIKNFTIIEKSNLNEALELKGSFNQIILKTNNNNLELDLDFLCFSNNELKIIEAIKNDRQPGVCLGVWPGKNNGKNFTDEIKNIENSFQELGHNKKFGIVHIFLPFFNNKDSKTENYFSIDKINGIIYNDYLPMLTLESRFNNSSLDQPNLKKIADGKYDEIIIELALKIKKVDGMVLIRILHEFNGDWYPWSISRNNKDQKLFKNAFRHIVNLFRNNNVENVKFIWCTNSSTVPQENWNQITDAYPGNEFVDFTGIDIYNGAGNSENWQSFIKEGIETYYILNKKFPDKSIIICETASREKTKEENSFGQEKSEWIKQMAQSLQFEMKNVRLLCWFNETDKFKIQSSGKSYESFYKNIIDNPYFNEGVECIYNLLR